MDNSDPIQFISEEEGGWIILLVIQGIYLSLDVFEAASEKIAYGIMASGFMSMLGIMIILYAVFDFKNKKSVVRPVLEGSFYIFFAVVLYYYKERRYKSNKAADIKNKLQSVRIQKLDNYIEKLHQSLSN